MKNVINASRRFAATAGGKVAAGASALMASGAAFASGASPGSAISTEMAGGKVEVMLVIGAAAIIIGSIILWGYVKKVR
ncbi:hypothetical protein [uncultured Stenotrophomonas sp.]|uniref:hypothetical protein n=1 Tax=uncultured Stenotrophomonas sp. TaxID=165438 RepID=UPI0025CB9144|nr:hypothetical protein [uncultured Stenotrophomonas sp.]